MNKFQHYPTSWRKYCSLVKEGSSIHQFHLDRGRDINRFAARYRVAKSLKNVELEGYSRTVLAGYSALIKAALSYSALEAYSRLFVEKNLKKQLRAKNERTGKKREKELFESAKFIHIQTYLVQLDKEKGLLKFLIEETNEHLERQLNSFNPESTLSVYYLCQSVRHIFVHGNLTPSIEATNPKLVEKICLELSRIMLSIVDDDFTSVIEHTAC